MVDLALIAPLPKVLLRFVNHLWHHRLEALPVNVNSEAKARAKAGQQRMAVTVPPVSSAWR